MGSWRVRTPRLGSFSSESKQVPHEQTVAVLSIHSLCSSLSGLVSCMNQGTIRYHPRLSTLVSYQSTQLLARIPTFIAKPAAVFPLPVVYPGSLPNPITT